MAKKPTSPFTLAARLQLRQRIPYCHIFAAALVVAMLGSLKFPQKIFTRKKEAAGQTKRTMQQPIEDASVKYVEVPSGRGDVKRYAAVQNFPEQKPISIQSWMTLVSSNSSVGIQATDDLSTIITSSPYSSILFEMPGASWQSSNEDKFEFAIVNEPALQMFAENSPDRYAFKEHFRKCKKGATVCSFANLGGDAKLVSPLPQTDISDRTYSHLGAFVRNAPKSQVTEFWRKSAVTYLDVLKEKHNQQGAHAKTWFSTNGMGVAWLHLRLDSRPKYYSYGPFRN